MNHRPARTPVRRLVPNVFAASLLLGCGKPGRTDGFDGGPNTTCYPEIPGTPAECCISYAPGANPECCANPPDRVCPLCCGTARSPDGGPMRQPDGGAICFC